MAASAWVVHDKAKQKMLNGTLDLDTDLMEMRLYTSASNISTASLSDASTATNEVAGGTGYAADALTVTVTESAGTTTVDSTDGQWTAAGGSITARYAAIIDTSATPDEVICHCQLDTGDVTATDGNTFTVQINASGVFTLT